MRQIIDPSSRRVSRRFVWISLPLALCCAGSALAAPGEISLAEIRRVAATSAPAVAARSARVEAARADAARADALPDPSLSIGIDNLAVTGADAFRLGSDDMTMRRIGVMQDWPSRHKRDARRASAEAQLVTAIDEVEATRLEAERQAGDVWIEVWAAEAEVRFLQTLIGEADRAVEIAKAQLANATGSTAGALTAEVARAELDNELRRAQSQVLGAQAGLARWLDSEVSIDVASMPDLSELRVPAEILRTRLDQHANLQVWQGRQREAAAAVTLAAAEKRPDLGFALSYGARSAGLSDMLMFEVSFGLPLFARNRQDREIAARRAEHEAVEAEREDARRAQHEGLERLLASWDGMRDELARYHNTLLPLARDRSATALAGYAGGGDIQAWLDARRDEISSGRRALQLQADLARAWLALDTLLPDDNSKEARP